MNQTNEKPAELIPTLTDVPGQLLMFGAPLKPSREAAAFTGAMSKPNRAHAQRRQRVKGGAR